MCTASWLHRPETYFHFQHLLFRRPIFQPRAFRFDRNPPSHLILSHIDACIDDKRKEKGSSTQTRKGAYRSIERVLSTRDKGKRTGRWSKQRNENSRERGRWKQWIRISGAHPSPPSFFARNEIRRRSRRTRSRPKILSHRRTVKREEDPFDRKPTRIAS